MNMDVLSCSVDLNFSDLHPQVWEGLQKLKDFHSYESAFLCEQIDWGKCCVIFCYYYGRYLKFAYHRNLCIIVFIAAVTLNEVINVHMNTIRQTNVALMKPFSLSIFHNILNIVQSMHEKGWSHRDLHCKLYCR